MFGFLIATVPMLVAQVGQPAQPTPPPIVAYLDDNRVYTSYTDIPQSVIRGGFYLLRTDCRRSEGKQSKVEKYFPGGAVSSYDPYQFHVAHTLIWGGSYEFPCLVCRIPFEDLKYRDSRLNVKQYLELHRKEFVKKHPNIVPSKKGGRDPHEWDLQVDVGRYANPGLPKRVRGPEFSFLPTSPTNVKAFVVDPDGKMKVTNCKGTWNENKSCWDVACGKEEDKFAVPFLEPFYVTGRKHLPRSSAYDYYFLTESGELYIAPYPEKDKERKVKIVWQNKKLPIKTFIADNDHKKSYCFAKSKDGKQEVFFELGPKVEPQPVPREKIQPVKGVKQERLRIVLEYVQILPSRVKVLKKK